MARRDLTGDTDEPADPEPLPPGQGTRAAPGGRLLIHGYVFVDWVTQGYIALAGLLVVVLHGSSVPRWELLVAIHAAALVVVHLLIRSARLRPQCRVLDFLRSFYPVFLYLGFYSEIGMIDHMLFSGFLDPFFIRLDQRIFGVQPSLFLMVALPYRPLSELLYASYFSYYVMIAGVGLALYLRDRREFFHFLSVMTFTFCCCYLLFDLFPVMGPRIFYEQVPGYSLPVALRPASVPAVPEAVAGGPFFLLMGWIYRTFETGGAAFPSAHVAIALVTLWFSFRYLRPIRWLHLALVVLLCFSTVYCRYHYAVDVAGGILVAALLVPLGSRLSANWPAPGEGRKPRRVRASP